MCPKAIIPTSAILNSIIIDQEYIAMSIESLRSEIQRINQISNNDEFMQAMRAFDAMLHAEINEAKTPIESLQQEITALNARRTEIIAATIGHLFSDAFNHLKYEDVRNPDSYEKLLENNSVIYFQDLKENVVPEFVAERIRSATNSLERKQIIESFIYAADQLMSQNNFVAAQAIFGGLVKVEALIKTKKETYISPEAAMLYEKVNHYCGFSDFNLKQRLREVEGPRLTSLALFASRSIGVSGQIEAMNLEKINIDLSDKPNKEALKAEIDVKIQQLQTDHENFCREEYEKMKRQAEGFQASINPSSISASLMSGIQSGINESLYLNKVFLILRNQASRISERLNMSHPDIDKQIIAGSVDDRKRNRLMMLIAEALATENIAGVGKNEAVATRDNLKERMNAYFPALPNPDDGNNAKRIAFRQALFTEIGPSIQLIEAEKRSQFHLDGALVLRERLQPEEDRVKADFTQATMQRDQGKASLTQTMSLQRTIPLSISAQPRIQIQDAFLACQIACNLGDRKNAKELIQNFAKQHIDNISKDETLFKNFRALYKEQEWLHDDVDTKKSLDMVVNKHIQVKIDSMVNACNLNNKSSVSNDKKIKSSLQALHKYITSINDYGRLTTVLFKTEALLNPAAPADLKAQSAKVKKFIADNTNSKNESIQDIVKQLKQLDSLLDKQIKIAAKHPKVEVLASALADKRVLLEPINPEPRVDTQLAGGKGKGHDVTSTVKGKEPDRQLNASMQGQSLFAPRTSSSLPSSNTNRIQHTINSLPNVADKTKTSIKKSYDKVLPIWNQLSAKQESIKPPKRFEGVDAYRAKMRDGFYIFIAAIEKINRTFNSPYNANLRDALINHVIKTYDQHIHEYFDLTSGRPGWDKKEHEIIKHMSHAIKDMKKDLRKIPALDANKTDLYNICTTELNNLFKHSNGIKEPPTISFTSPSGPIVQQSLRSP